MTKKTIINHLEGIIKAIQEGQTIGGVADDLYYLFDKLNQDRDRGFDKGE